MNFSDVNVKTITEHPTTLVSLINFENNDPDHFLSLSDDGHVKEWLFNTANGASKEIDQCVLIRPSDEILRENKHKIPKLRKNDYLKITKSISFNHFIVLGYEDGLILVYSQEVQKGIRLNHTSSFQNENGDDNANANNSNDNKKINTPNIEDDTKHIKEEEEDNDEGKGQEQDNEAEGGGGGEKQHQQKQSQQQQQALSNEDKFPIKKYYNAFSLYYILLGHSQRITSLYYIKAKNFLVTASDNFIVKIYDMETGHSLYHFNLDCIVSQIIFINENKKQELIFLCQEPYKLVIDISQEPFSFNHYTFKYNNINQLYECNSNSTNTSTVINKAILLPGKSSNFYWFTPTMEYKEEIKEASNDSFEYIMQYQNMYVVFDDKMKMRLIDINLKPKESSMRTLFKIPIGRDSVTEGMNIGAWGVIACQDGNVYCVEFEKELALYWNRSRMSEEDKGSELMNKALDSKKGKKGKKGAKETTSRKGKEAKEKREAKLPKIKESTSKPKTKGKQSKVK